MDLNDNKDLKFIKKHYGEDFAKLCRKLFPTLLEHPGLLATVVSTHIEPTKSLVADIVDEQLERDVDAEEIIKNYVYSFVDVERNEPHVLPDKTAEELFDEAGYVLYPECKTEEDIQKFRKYYANGEELCTFRGDRLNFCRVWFAVKKNVDEIKRENFTTPQRQDEYGTSVISIQYTKKEPSTLSIKNRYNHRVNNPDATFSNNLNNIIPGLKEVFENQFFILAEQNSPVQNLDHYVYVGQKMFRYNCEIDNVYYCSNNVIIDNFEVKRFDKARYIVFENYIIDKKEKTIVCYNNTKDPKKNYDEFTRSIGEIKDIKEVVKKGGRDIIITPQKGEDIVLGISNDGELLDYYNSNVKKIGDDFLTNNHLRGFNAPNLIKIGSNCLNHGKFLTSFVAPKLEKVGVGSLSYVNSLTNIYAPRLKEAGEWFLCNAQSLSNAEFPNLEKVAGACFSNVGFLKNFSAPKLKVAGHNFLAMAGYLTNLDVPKLQITGHGFLCRATSLKTFDAPSLKKLGGRCMRDVPYLETFNAPELRSMEDSCLCETDRLTKFIAPKLEKLGGWVLGRKTSLRSFYAPRLKTAGEQFLRETDSIDDYNCPIVPEHWNARVRR